MLDIANMPPLSGSDVTGSCPIRASCEYAVSASFQRCVMVTLCVVHILFCLYQNIKRSCSVAVIVKEFCDFEVLTMAEIEQNVAL